MNLEEKTVRKNYVYEGRILKLRCDDALLPDGNPCKREMIEHTGGACVLYVEDENVLLVRQYRYCYGEETYELPAGKLNEGEDPMLTAMRELEEETGFIADKLVHLFTVYPTPGYTNEKLYIYFAEKTVEGRVHLDEGEFLNSCFIPVNEVKEMIKNGEIRDAKTIIAVQQYLLSK